MREVCRHVRGCAPVLSLVLVALAGCGPSRAEVKERQDLAKYHYDLAYGYFFDRNNQHGEAALFEVLKSLEYNDKSADAHLLAGLVFQGRKRHLDAIRHYKRAVEIEPDKFYASNNLAVTYLAMERWDDAIGVLDKLLGNVLYDRPGHAHNNLGWAWYKKGDRQRAERHFLAAIERAESLCPAYNNLGLVYLEQKQDEKAERYLRRGLKRCPAYSEPWFHLGRLQARRGELQPARDSFERCVKYGGESSLADRCTRRLRMLAAGDAR